MDMRGRTYLVFLIALLASGCAARHVTPPAAAPFAQSLQVLDLRSAGRINDSLYRGGQPSDQGLLQLQKFGVDTIVDLRGEFRGTRENERRRAEALGMRFVSIPGSGWSPPTDQQVAEFFSLVQERPQRKIYVHCWLGTDRTGVFLAAYRIAFDGWNPDQAIAEMYAFHFKGFWHPAMKAYIRDFPARLTRSPALAPFGYQHRPSAD